MLGDESGHELSQSFFCLECSQTRETPLCGFTLLLPPYTPKECLSRTENGVTKQSVVCCMGDCTEASHGETVERSLDSDSSESRVAGGAQQWQDSPPGAVRGSSMRLAIRESLFEEQKRKQKQRHITDHLAHDSCGIETDNKKRANRKGSVSSLSALSVKGLLSTTSSSKSSWPNKHFWWDQTFAGRPNSFRVAGGFLSSSMHPNLSVYEWIPTSETDASTTNKRVSTNEGSWVINKPFVELDMLHYALKVPIIHSENACVVLHHGAPGDLLASPAEHLVWAFPQLRDCEDGRASAAVVATGRGKEVCFHEASVLRTRQELLMEDAIPGQVWRSQALGGVIPPARTGAAITYSAVLGGLLVHGGMVACKSMCGSVKKMNKWRRNSRNKSVPGWHYFSDDNEEEDGGCDHIESRDGATSSQIEDKHDYHNPSKGDALQPTLFSPVSTLYFLNTRQANSAYGELILCFLASVCL
jgi:hypothetical protein